MRGESDRDVRGEGQAMRPRAAALSTLLKADERRFGDRPVQRRQRREPERLGIDPVHELQVVLEIIEFEMHADLFPHRTHQDDVLAIVREDDVSWRPHARALFKRVGWPALERPRLDRRGPSRQRGYRQSQVINVYLFVDEPACVCSDSARAS